MSNWNHDNSQKQEADKKTAVTKIANCDATTVGGTSPTYKYAWLTVCWKQKEKDNHIDFRREIELGAKT